MFGCGFFTTRMGVVVRHVIFEGFLGNDGENVHF